MIHFVWTAVRLKTDFANEGDKSFTALVIGLIELRDLLHDAQHKRSTTAFGAHDLNVGMTARFAPGEPRRNGASSWSGPGPRWRSRRRRSKARQSGQYCRSRRARTPGSGDRGGPLCFSVRPIIEAIRAACAIGVGSRRLISRLAAEFVPCRINDFCKREIGRIAPTAARAVQSIQQPCDAVRTQMRDGDNRHRTVLRTVLPDPLVCHRKSARRARSGLRALPGQSLWVVCDFLVAQPAARTAN